MVRFRYPGFRRTLATVVGVVGLLAMTAGVTAARADDEREDDARKLASGPGEPGKLAGLQQQETPAAGSGADRRTRGGRKPPTPAGTKPTPTGQPPQPNPAPPVAPPNELTPTTPSETVTSKLNLDAENMLKPRDERTYSFSIVNGSYKELVENFGRMASLPVLGEAPQGELTYISAMPMEFKAAMNRVRVLLFKYKPLEPYWLDFTGEQLEVMRVTDYWRRIGLDHIFTSVADFEQARLDDSDLAMVLYSPTDTSVSDFTFLRDFMPDYVRIGAMPDTNSLSIYAMVGDIKKYLSLIRLFDGASKDPRVLLKLPVTHVTPTEAVDTLKMLMDELDESGTPRPKGRRAANADGTTVDLPGQRTILFPDDAQGVIVVRAVQSQIDHIKEMLVFVDVEFGEKEAEPVLISLKHAKADEMVAVLTPILTGRPTGVAAAQPEMPGKGRRARPKAGPMSTESVTMIPEPRTNRLVVLGTQEEVERVRRLVPLFDVPAADSKPIFVPLNHATADTVTSVLVQVITPKAMQSGGTQFQAIAEVGSNSIILMGREEDIAAAKEVIAQLDVASDLVSLHRFKLINATPQSVIEILTLMSNQGAAGAAVAAMPAPAAPKAGGKRRPPRRAPNTPPGGNLHANDATNTLYVLCSEAQWNEEYLPLIQSLDAAAAEGQATTTVALKFLGAEEAIATLTSLLAGDPKQVSGGTKMAPTANGILVHGGTPSELEQIRAIVALIDVESGGRERRLFEIRYADPAELQGIIQSTMAGGPVRKRGRTGKGVPLAAAQAGVEGGVNLGVIGRTLVATGTTEELDDIAQLIAQLDVATGLEHALRVYSVPPAHDAQNIATQLESLISHAPTIVRKGRAANVGAVPAGALPSGDGQDVRVVAQSSARKILISAPVDRFPDIETALAKLLEGEAPEKLVIKFIPVKHADAGMIVSLIEPILQVSMADLASAGEIQLDQPDKAARVAGPKVSAGGLRVMADVHGERIIVTAPATLVTQAESLIAELDRPGLTDERALRTVTLERTEPEKMVETIAAILAGKTNAPAPRRLRPKAPQDGAVQGPPTSTLPEGVTVAAAPGGGAVVISGPVADVDEVERWVRGLDSSAKSDHVLKIYHIKSTPIDDLADTIMALCDTMIPKGPMPKGRGTDDGFDLEPSNVRAGVEITLTTDHYNKIILARATPRKIYDIDQVVDMYEGKDGAPPAITTHEISPYMIYELEHVDAFDASIQLESMMEKLWPFGGSEPDVEYISDGNQLVVKCKPEHNAFVEDLLVKYVDKEATKKGPKEVVKIRSIEGATASDVAAMLKARLPWLAVDMEQLSEEIPAIEEIKPYKPDKPAQPPTQQKCVLPTSLSAALGAAGHAAIGQTAAEDEEKRRLAEKLSESFAEPGAPAPEKPAKEAGAAASDPVSSKPANESKDRPGTPLRLGFDDRSGVIVLRGSARDIEEVDDILDDLLDEIEKLSGKPDIRVYRIKYRDVSVVSNILETMFNAVTRNPQQNQMQQLMQQRAMAQAAARVAAAKGGQPGQPPAAAAGMNIDPMTGLPVEEKQEEQRKTGTGQMRIYPDPQTRTIIVRADTEDFPIIVELLATIDRPADVTSDFKLYKLERLVAADVEEQLKALLGINQQPRRMTQPQQGGRQRGGAGQQQNPAIQQLEEQLMNLAMAGDMGQGINVQSDVMITSNPQANTIIARAPQAALEVIGKLIVELESQKIAVLDNRTYTLKHADAVDAADHFKQLFGSAVRSNRGSAQGSDVDPLAINEALFIADGRANTLTVRALDVDIPKIEPLILEYDRDLGTKESVRTFQIQNGDAVQIASTLTSIYGTGKGKDGARAIKFVGDTPSNTLLVTAPDALLNEVSQKIKELDDKATEPTKPRVVKLQAGNPTDVARILSSTFERPAGKGGRGAIKIIGDDVGGQLIITAPNEVYDEIRSLAETMDKSAINIQMRVFKLAHARAADVHGQLMNMVQQLARQVGANKKEMDVFTAVVDERSNAIVCMGGPGSFLLVEQVLKEIDIPKDETTAARTRKIFTFEHADAVQIAQTINDEIRNTRTGAKGQEPVSVLPNEALNAIVVTGSAEDVESALTLAKELDRAPTAGRRERIMKLQHANADELARNLQNMFRQNSGGQRTPTSQMTLAGDLTTNSLIISANDAEFARVQELVTKLDAPGAADAAVHVIEIQNADAEAVAQALTQMFVQGAGRGVKGPNAVQISSARGSKMIMVKAGPKDFEEIKAAVAQMDTSTAASGEIHVVALQHTDAELMRETLENYLRKPGQRGGGPGGDLAGDVRITANVQNNSLVISGEKEQIAKLLDVIRTLDVEVEGAGNAPRLITLQHVSPSQIEPTLTQMFVENAQRGGRGGGASTMTPVIAADDASKTLIVRAGAGDFGMIEELVAKLDTESQADKETFTVIPVADGVLVEDLGPLVESTINEGERSQAERLGIEPRTVVITPDPRTNALLVAGSASLFPAVEELTHKLESMGITGGKRTMVLKTTFTSPDEVQRFLQQVIDEAGGKGGSSKPKASGSSRSAVKKPPARSSSSRGSAAKSTPPRRTPAKAPTPPRKTPPRAPAGQSKPRP